MQAKRHHLTSGVRQYRAMYDNVELVLVRQGPIRRNQIVSTVVAFMLKARTFYVMSDGTSSSRVHCFFLVWTKFAQLIFATANNIECKNRTARWLSEAS